MAHPAAQIGDEPFLQMLGDIEEGWRAGSAVQIFIAAADRQLGPGPIEVDRHGADAVAEVPEGRRARRLGSSGDGGHVAAVTAIIDRKGVVRESVCQYV